jgi:hypothetical protein
MDLRLGEIAVLTKELTEELTGSAKNNKFLISVVTDDASSLRNLGNRKSYTVRNEVLASNIKWFEEKFERHDRPNTSKSKPTPTGNVTAKVNGFRVDFSGSAKVDTNIDSGIYTITPDTSGKVGVTRIDTTYSYTTNDSDPYGGDGGVYG